MKNKVSPLVKKKLVYEVGWNVLKWGQSEINEDGIEERIMSFLSKAMRGFDKKHAHSLLEAGKMNYIKCEINIVVADLAAWKES